LTNQVGNRKKILKLENKAWIFSSLFFSFFILVPILIVFSRIFIDKSETFIYLWKTLLLDYTLNTIYLVFLTSFFSLILGIIPAWVISIYRFPFRKFYDIILFLPLAIPTYIMAFTYSDILSFTGPLQSFLRNNVNSIYPLFNNDYLQIELLGFFLALSLSPYIYSVSRVSFSMIGSSYLDISKNLGLSSFKTFWKIILPLSRPAIFAGLFLVIMEVLNEYGAVKYFGVNTFTTGIFRSWFSFGDINSAIQLSSVLILFVLIIIILENLSVLKSKFNYKTNSNLNNLISLSNYKSFFANVLCLFSFLISFLIPLVFIFINSLKSIDKVDLWILFELTQNSLSISIISALIVVFLATFFEYCEKLSNNSLSKVINRFISLGYAIPGAVVALGLIIFVTGFNDYLNSKYVIGSFSLMIYALVVRFLAVGKSPVKTSFEKQPESFNETGKIIGFYPLKLFQKIHLPININALIIAFIVCFVDLMKELPITLILRPFNFDTLATQTYEFAIEEMLMQSSIYSLTIVTICSIMLLVLRNMINFSSNASRS
tara:strand:+ start:3018 stop:4652 length:1635 start_codon:yes stop_codon:yes gene_type:complete